MSRIFSDGQPHSVEWAARDTPGSARRSSVTPRLPPSTTAEDPWSEDGAPTAPHPATPTPNLSWNEYLLTPETDHPPVTSPDPIMPGDVIYSAISQPNPPGSSSLLRNHKPFAQHSAPAEMGRPHKRLSVSDSLQSTGTWDEVKKQRLWANTEREETLAGIGEETPPEEVKVDDTLPEKKGEQPQRPAPKSVHTAPPTAGLVETTLVDPASEQQAHVGRVPISPNDSAPAGGSASGRAVEWGTPFKVQWIRTDPLSFHRTKHLKNPWNSDVRFQFSSQYFTDILFPA